MVKDQKSEAPKLPPIRRLNDYESMLANMTCNVGMSLSLPNSSHETIEASLCRAWKACVAERYFLQVKIVPIEDEMGPSGQRYTLEPINRKEKSSLFDVCKVTSMPDLVRELQKIGTGSSKSGSSLDVSKGSYYVRCKVQEDGENVDNFSVQVIMSLSHSLSDGPGALRIARSFLEHLYNAVDNDDAEASNDNHALKPPQPLTDLQAMILGSNYAVNEEERQVFEGQAEFTAALADGKMDDATVLLPESMQDLPFDDGFGGPSYIDCVHFALSAQETSSLREACRQHGTTVQGAVTAASLKTRAELLLLDLPVEAAVQIPVNTRALANVDQDECLCGSAGVWHLARVGGDGETDLFGLGKRSTDAVRFALENHDGAQPREWLRRLFHAPATLPSYSLMVSSIGVAPVEPSYKSVNVQELFFFGGALRTDSPSKAQSTMIHVVTFRDRLTCMINFTSPGVSRKFAENTAKTLEATLLSMAKWRHLNS